MQDWNVAVIGLGYVGLPLAVRFADQLNVLGFDINSKRINELRAGFDRTKEVPEIELKRTNMRFSSNKDDLANRNLFIITVPTPITPEKKPDLRPIISASKMIASYIKKGAIVVYESTVYPGCTEEICVPLLEKISGLKYNQDFFCGYSPERMNPGDPNRTVDKIVKVVSGSTPEILEKLADLYASIVTAGIYKASSIKVAEAAKVIENTQRDINIAFVNELSIIFEKMNLDTLEVLEAAGTKWNFLPFRPGLVGGHCIGVDPYYLTYKAEAVGYHPEVILSGRRINDGMGKYVAEQTIKMMIKSSKTILDSKVLLLGATFKENCPDIRNTRVVDIYHELREFGCDITIYDPIADDEEIHTELGIEKILSNLSHDNLSKFDAVLVCVAHNEFKEVNYKDLMAQNIIVYDLKGVTEKDSANKRL